MRAAIINFTSRIIMRIFQRLGIHCPPCGTVPMVSHSQLSIVIMISYSMTIVRGFIMVPGGLPVVFNRI